MQGFVPAAARGAEPRSHASAGTEGFTHRRAQPWAPALVQEVGWPGGEPQNIARWLLQSHSFCTPVEPSPVELPAPSPAARGAGGARGALSCTVICRNIRPEHEAGELRH